MNSILGQPDPTGRTKPAAAVNVTIDLATLLGLADNPGELDGYGPIPASLARRLAEGGDLRRFITDPQTGHLLDRSPRTYRPSKLLHDYIVARDLTRCFPGCGYPAMRNPLDHTREHNRGGDTIRRNLGPCTWTSPAGHDYHVTPHDYRPDG